MSRQQDDLRSFADNFISVTPTDDKQYTDEHPFCLTTPSCPCHEDSDLLAPIAQAVNDGLMTPNEATDYVMGRTLQGGWA